MTYKQFFNIIKKKQTNMPFLFAFDTTEQHSIAGGYKDITFNNNVILSGWNHAVDSANFTHTATGSYVYRITYTARGDYKTTVPSLAAVGIRALKNGVVIPGSQAGKDIASESIGETFQITNTFLVTFSPGNVLQLELFSTSTDFKLSRDEGILNAPGITLTIDSV